MDNQFRKAALIAPLTPVVVLFFLFLLQGSFQYGFLALFFALITSYLATFLLGIPTLKVLQRYKALNLITLVLAGSILGVFAFYGGLYLLSTFFIFKSSLNTSTVFWGAISGFSVSLVFGLISDIKIWHKKQIKN